MSALGDLIRQYLATHPDAHKKDIAEAAGVSAQSVSGWLSGTKAPNLKNDSIIGLAEVLGVEPWEVVLAVTKDRGIPVQIQEHADTEGVQVTVATLRKLTPERLRLVAQFAASLAEDEARKPRRKGKRGQSD